MSIATELIRLLTAKENIKTSLVNKGAVIADDAKLDEYSTIIDELPSGGEVVDTWLDLHTAGKEVDIVIPNGLTTSYLFTSCNGLRSVTWNDSNTIEDYCFYSSSLKRLNSNEEGVANIPLNVTTINGSAFSNCYNIKKMDLSNNTNLKSFGTNCFAASGITELKLPENLTTIPTFCIVGMSDLQYLRVPDSVTSIANYQYGNGTNGYPNPRGIVWDFGNTRTTIPTLGGIAFIESGSSINASLNQITKIVVPDALYDDWKLATNWSNVKFQPYYIKYTDYYGS